MSHNTITDAISASETTETEIEYVVQVPPEEHTVTLTAGDVVTARLPDEQEQKALGLPLGVWVLAVAHADDSEELHDANRTRLIRGED
jgi:hypothetical protein